MLNLLGAPYRMLDTATYLVNRSIQVAPEITEAAIKQSRAVQTYWTAFAVQGLIGTLRAMNSLYCANLRESFSAWADTFRGGMGNTLRARVPVPSVQGETTRAASSFGEAESKAASDPGSAGSKVVELGKPKSGSVKKGRPSRQRRKRPE